MLGTCYFAPHPAGTHFTKLKLSVLGLCCSLLLTACSANKVNLAIYLSPEVAQTYGEVPSLEVDVAGVTAEQKQALEQTAVEQYFAPHSAVRSSIQPVTLYFSPLQQRPYSIEKSFAAWELWQQRGAQYVMVLCNLPQLSAAPQSAAPQGAAAPDSRMLFIEMHDGFIKDSSSHIVEITSSGVIKVADEPEEPSGAEPSAASSAQEQALAAAQAAEEQALAAVEEQAQAATVAPALDAATDLTLDPAFTTVGSTRLNTPDPFAPIVLE